MLTLIAALARNRAIGNKGKLLYWLPNDMRRFRTLTTGHTIIMGRKTYDSLPHGALPNRRNIVLSRTVKHIDGCDVYPTLPDALAALTPEEDAYVIGGATVYEQALPLADKLALTLVDDTPQQTDAFFPDFSNWHEVSREHHDTDEKHKQQYDFVDYERS